MLAGSRAKIHDSVEEAISSLMGHVSGGSS
jgi:hypothetical protein